MKKIILAAGVISAIILSSFTNMGYSEVYKVDTKVSTLEWFAEKIGGKHNGVVNLSGGSIASDHGKLTGSFDINMTSITVRELTGEWAAKLEGHLKSEDFFNTEKFPAAKFVIISATPINGSKKGGFTHHVKGNLTIKDKTNEIDFDATIKTEGKRSVA